MAGAMLACGSSVLLFAVAPYLRALALLAPDVHGSSLWAGCWLAILGLLVTLELPLMLVVMLRMARRGAPAGVLNTIHLAYTAAPALYGALGAVLTGERWWLLLTALFVPLRLAASLFILPSAPPARPKEKPAAVALTADEPPTRTLAAVRGFVLDMDGVLYRGSQVRTGALAFIRYLNERGIPYLCLTNNASKTSEMYEATLREMGLPIRADQVLGAARAAAEWLAGSMPPGARLFVIGEAGLREELRAQGFAVVNEGPSDGVVVGIDRELSYAKLAAATRAILNGARFIGTNPDRTFPAEEGLLPGNGATLAYLEAATGVAPTVVGKPERAMMQVAATHLGLPPARLAMVGDRIDTDILGGQRVGMLTVLLRGGVTPDDEIAAAPIQADYVFDDLGELLKALQAENVETLKR